jgi:hypothetical protein
LHAKGHHQGSAGLLPPLPMMMRQPQVPLQPPVPLLKG